MSTIPIYCSKEEHLQKLKDSMQLFDLISFVRNQQTNEVLAFEPSNSALEKIWDLWLGKRIPISESKEVPAQAGWILVNPPRYNLDKRIILPAEVGARFDWLDNSDPSEPKNRKNEDLKSLFSKVKRLFFKNTILGSTTLVDSRTGLESDWGKERYTLGALAMQDNGWRFAESPSSYGFLKFIDTFDARKKKTRG